MFHTMSVRKKCEENEAVEGGSCPPAKRIVSKVSADDEGKKILDKRLKDVEFCVPIVYGTMAFWLGRKATESQSHKWTVYVRGATNEDLGVVIKRVVFHLHPSFSNSQRVVESPPFMLSECGWGEFEIAISLVFHSDVCDKRLTLHHQLKLYSENEFCPLTTKRPIVMESYDEIVFSDPSEVFFARVQNHPALTVQRLPSNFVWPTEPNEDAIESKRGDTKEHSLSQWFTNFSEADELLKLSASRQQVQAYIVKMRRQLGLVQGTPNEYVVKCD